MPKINKLDPSIYNLISAGEVVENPASVVKELVENSIDAGASEITISIENGGIDQIKIIDNGVGMDKDNMYLSYLPHATSKVSAAIDLDNISTLGFRGEALASIAAVSHLNITSKELNKDFGYYINVSSGIINDEGEIGTTQGTIVCVNNLFYNTPVRLKFLKTPKQEESLVTSKVIQLIFANSDIKFKYYVNGELVYQTMGGLEDSIYSVYGNDIANGLLPFDITYSGIRVYGYTSKNSLIKHNKSYETIIVNGRPIMNATISTAVMQSYGNVLMKRTYPIYIINIVMPFEEVDVNVHPTKSDVRFQDNHKVFSAVYRAINTALETQEKSVFLKDLNKDLNTEHIFNALKNKTYEHESYEQKQTNVSASSNSNNETSTNLDIFSDLTDNSNLKNGISKDIYESSNLENRDYSYEKSLIDNSNLYNNSYKKTITSKVDIFESSALKQLDNDITEGYIVIGQLFETFLIIQDFNKAYLIDQHACHEKFLYEKLINSIDKKEISTQPLLIPYVYQCSSNQYDCMLSIKENLCQLGFDIEEFGGLSFKINEVPTYLVNINFSSFFEDILNDKSITKAVKASDILKEKLAQSACKAAVKSGDKLSDSQIRELFKQMKNGIPMQCPHGRPCIFEFSRNDLDKLFKRLV